MATLRSLRVTLGKPVKVSEAVGHAWFPIVHQLPNQELVAMWSMMPDIHAFAYVSGVSHSSDGGRSWSPPYSMGQWSNQCLPLSQPRGAARRVPYYIYPDPPGQARDFCTDLYTLHPGGRYEVEPRAVKVTGFPEAVQVQATGAAMMNFNGTAVVQPDRWLFTLYGTWAGQGIGQCSLLLFESRDQGRSWRYVSAIARHGDVTGRPPEAPGPPDYQHGGPYEGPDESSLCELEGGELLCVYRVGSGMKKWPYRSSRSADGGRTWSPPAILRADIGSVEPSLLRLHNGPLALSGGRPGLHLWLDAKGRGNGEDWQHLDITAHHNATCEPRERMAEDGSQTTAYTELCEYAPNRMLMIYDRTPLGWKEVPLDAPDRNMIFVVDVAVERE